MIADNVRRLFDDEEIPLSAACWRCNQSAVPGSAAGLCGDCRRFLAGGPSVADRAGWLPFTAWQHRLCARLRAKANPR